MNSSLSSVVVRAKARHTASVIFIHGLGDTGYGWEPVAQLLSRSLPHVKFVLPTAPEQPVTLNGGFRMPSWFDIRSLNKIAVDEDEDGMNASLRRLNELVRAEIDSGIPAKRIVLGGFSQGGAMSLFTGLQLEHQLAGLAVLSGYLPVRERIMARATDASKRTPIFQAHGTADEVVLYQYGEMTAEALRQSGYAVDFHSYRHMGHSSCDEELRDLLAFLTKCLPEQDKFKVELKLASSRLRLLQEKQTALSTRARRGISELLESGKAASAAVRVEGIIRDDLHVEAMEIVELFCELLCTRAGLIDQSATVDPGLGEAVSSVIYASGRIDIKELPRIRDMLGAKYGKDVVAGAMDNADGRVNARLVQKLSLDPPSERLVRVYLKEIAAAYRVDWAPEGDDDDAPSGGLRELAAAVPSPIEVTPADSEPQEPPSSGAKGSDSAKESDSETQLPSVPVPRDPTPRALEPATVAEPADAATKQDKAPVAKQDKAPPGDSGVPTMDELQRRLEALRRL
ncbi:hypothetical protein H4R18_000904 [Coemansia javaensis]|uniref:Acyl-protein thioesterase 1 n=1 Tax=Coemansia javaensis TaxID=2761396 RepID=A0A9W8LM40_9FUNG|nr:hypothetical protein H4R18_000904 [Coemansia javaensis]